MIWTVRVGEIQYQASTEEEVLQWYRERRIPPSALVHSPDAPQWQRVDEFAAPENTVQQGVVRPGVGTDGGAKLAGGCLFSFLTLGILGTVSENWPLVGLVISLILLAGAAGGLLASKSTLRPFRGFFILSVVLFAASMFMAGEKLAEINEAEKAAAKQRLELQRQQQRAAAASLQHQTHFGPAMEAMGAGNWSAGLSKFRLMNDHCQEVQSDHCEETRIWQAIAETMTGNNTNAAEVLAVSFGSTPSSVVGNMLVTLPTGPVIAEKLVPVLEIAQRRADELAKIEQERQRLAEKAAEAEKRGPAPDSDLQVHSAVREWLTENHIDAKIIDTGSSAYEAGPYWAVSVTLRGENAFGGKVNQTLICYMRREGFSYHVDNCR
jgi:hypothetical protein